MPVVDIVEQIRERPTPEGVATDIPAEIIQVDFILKCPAEIRLGTLRDHRFRVNGALLVKREESEGRVVAAAPELNEFGFGENFSDAVTDLQRAIVELYLTLKDDEDRLGPDLQKVWATLQERISLKL